MSRTHTHTGTGTGGGRLVMMQNGGAVLPEEFTWPQFNCIGGVEANKALMEPNDFLSAVGDSLPQSLLMWLLEF